jgi:hypothetical protein
MSEHQLKEAIENTQEYRNYEKFKQGIVLRRANLVHLNDLLGQAQRLGIDYLKQNPNIMHSDVKLIEELLKNM